MFVFLLKPLIWFCNFCLQKVKVKMSFYFVYLSFSSHIEVVSLVDFIFLFYDIFFGYGYSLIVNLLISLILFF